MNYEAIMTFTMQVAREAGVLLRAGLTEVKEIDRKSSAIDLVTQFDKAAEALITKRIRAKYPAHKLFAEESGESEGSAETDPFIWYIDPIDGTINYAHGLPHYAISLALYRGQQPILGIVYDPSRDEMFHVIAGQGTWLTTPQGKRPLSVTDAPDLLNSLLATGFPYDRHTSNHDNTAQFMRILKKCQGVRRLGSAALDLAYVAAGRLDGYWEYKLGAWDIAAGLLLVQGAGGQVSTAKGAPLTLGSDKISVAAGNSAIHSAILSEITSL